MTAAAEATTAATGSDDTVVAGMAGVLAELLGVPQVPAGAHFFDDLGADSLVMAHFCARVRKRADLPPVSIRDIYQHPTIELLASAGRTAATAPPATAHPTPAPTAAPVTAAADLHPSATPAPRPPAPPAGDPLPEPAGRPHVALCGFLQVVVFLGYTYASTAVALRGVAWVTSAPDLAGAYGRAVVVGAALFAWTCVFPVVAKWVLVGRFRPARIRVWSLAYVRFWIVKTLIKTSPLARFYVGSPLHLLYLRALGARVGRGVVVLTRTWPVVTDLLWIGDGTIIRKDCVAQGYRAVAGVIETGPITLGRDVYVGEGTVLDIGTSLADGAQLGHSSSLHEGQSVPAGESWHGSPARRCAVDHRTVEPRACGGARRSLYSLLQLAVTTLLYLPLTIGVVDLIVSEVPVLSLDLPSGPLSSPAFWRDCLLVAGILLFGGILGSLLYVLTVPRLMRVLVRPGTVYPLYGLRWSLHRTIARTTNSKALTKLFGDSSYIVGYLRGLGYRLTPVLQTGSNFGTGVKHETPYLVTVGTGTMVADGLSVVDADFSSTSFRVSPTTIGPDNFLGNAVTYPTGGRTGRNVLLATKVLVPLDGPVREDVGLLGSPPFEIPRTVDRDTRLLEDLQEDVPRLLERKNRHNLRTIGLYLLVRWWGATQLLVLTLTCAQLYDSLGSVAMAAVSPLALVVMTGYGVLIERASTRFRPLQPRSCSIYDPAFWRHERFWKMTARPEVFNGTPLKNVVLRLLGTRVGRGVFDDGCSIPERSLVTIGDFCTLNAGCTLQPHSQEDAGFKSDRITLGAGCTVDVGAWVHYGSTVGDGAHVGPDAFLMKGEQVPAGAVWRGNPATDSGQPPRVPWSPPVPRPPVDAAPPAAPAAVLTRSARTGQGRHRARTHRSARRSR